jgi:AraC family transcriptional regulator, positive regulator of tynA and feaB
VLPIALGVATPPAGSDGEVWVPTRLRAGLADPDFGPREVAAVAGISLRYLQKLFTAHGSTCSEFIYSLRLDHAARLLHRRASLGTSQPLSEIAYACSFRDLRHRFGYSPGARSAGHGRAGFARCGP